MPPPDTGWEGFEREAERVVGTCAQAMHGLEPAGMLFPSFLGRLRALAREQGARVGASRDEINARVLPYEERVAELCGLPLPPLLE